MTSAFSRRRPWLIAAPVLAAALVVAGCSTDPASVAASHEVTVNDATMVADVSSAAATAADVLAGNQAPHDDESDATWDEDGATTIALSGSAATVSGDGATATDGTVLISAPGTYVLSGDFSGSVVVDSAAEGHVTIVLDGVDIDNESGPAIDIQAADEAIVILADGSTNSLSDTSTYPDDADANAALYSAADLTITGTGALSVTGNGNDGIASADGLVIQSGEIEVTAVDDGIRGKDYLVIRGGTISVDAGGDGLKSDNEEDAERGYTLLAGGDVTVTSGDDGIAAATDVVVTDGVLTIVSGEGAGVGDPDEGAKGISAGVIAVLEGGTVDIDAADDAINTDLYAHLAGTALTLASGDDGVHAEAQLVVSGGDNTVTESVEGLEAGQITIAGGATSVTSSDDGVNVSEPDSGSADLTLLIEDGTLLVDAGGDGLDVNQNGITQTGGTVVVSGPTNQGNGALDADGGMTISGGTLIAGGSAGMAVAPSADSAQASVQFTFTSSVAAGTVLTIVDASGAAVASFTTAKQTESLVYSGAAIVNGETYTLVSGGTAGESILGGLAAAGTAGTKSVATAVAGEQTSSGMGGPGGGQGGGPGGGPGGGQGGNG